jgi:phage tail-like protein
MRNFAVEVRWDGQDVSGVSWVGALQSSVDVVTVHDGGTGATFHVPGRADTGQLTIERGLEDDLAFDVWARGPQLRKEVGLRLVDSSDGLVVSFTLEDCWVCGYTVSPDLDTGSVVESLTLSVGRWRRDTPPAPDLAERLARERGSAVRRLDVGALVSEHLAETEAALEAVLAQADREGAVLLLDEADALFGRRTEVGDAHDRYAAAGIEALLERLSRYGGPVLVDPPARPDADARRTGVGAPPAGPRDRAGGPS